MRINLIFRVEYHYSPNGYDIGYTVTTGGGVSITRSLTRDPYRRQLVTSITNTLNTVPYCPLNYTYDELNRVTDRNDDTFGYNQRGEVVSADIEPSHSSRYDFDQIGNNRWASLNTATNYYTTSQFTQYAAIENGMLIEPKAAPPPPQPDKEHEKPLGAPANQARMGIVPVASTW